MIECIVYPKSLIQKKIGKVIESRSKFPMEGLIPVKWDVPLVDPMTYKEVAVSLLRPHELRKLDESSSSIGGRRKHKHKKSKRRHKKSKKTRRRKTRN